MVNSVAKGDLEMKIRAKPRDFSGIKETWGVVKKYPGPAIMATILSVGLGASLYLPVFYTSPTAQLRERYSQLQAQYADVDKDGFISREEKVDFDKELFRGREGVLNYGHVTCIPGDQNKSWRCQSENIPLLRYSSTGKEVPTETVLKWMNEYAVAQ